MLHKEVYCGIFGVNIEKKKMLNKISSFDLSLQLWRGRYSLSSTISIIER